MKMARHALVAALLGLIVFLAGYSYAVLTVSKSIPSGTQIVTDVYLSVYKMQFDTQQLVLVDWSTLMPSETKTYNIWVQNDATIPMSISISTNSYAPPEAQGYLNFSYAQGVGWLHYPTLDAGYRAQIVLSLQCTGTAIAGNFTFVIVVSGTTL
jgi:hypothetical protein